MNKTILYYNQNAKQFNDDTFKVDMESLYKQFLHYVEPNGAVLDLGCGSGRDTLYFKAQGFAVDAIDYSLELVEIARKQTGINVKHASFFDLADKQKFDGIWACASLLHCERSKLPLVVNKIYEALKPNGICYMSFKYGTLDRTKDGRNFTDLNEIQAKELFSPLNIVLLQQWITSDKRPNRTEEWLNILIKKIA